MNENPTDVLDPTHADDLPGIAGIPGPDRLPGQLSDAEWKASDDGNLVERGGTKYIREEALHAEREKNKALSSTLARLEPLMPEIAEFLQQKQQRTNANIDRTTRPGADSYANDDDLRGFALVRGYYKQDGVTPDLDRANTELNIMARIADRSAAKHVGPVAAATTRDRAATNYHDALSRRFVDGEPLADEVYMRQAFDALPEEYRADPNIANITSVIAVGLQALEERKTGKRSARRGEPLFREGASGRNMSNTDLQLDALERAAAKARGKTPEQWSKMSKAMNGDARSTGAILDEV